MVLTHNSCVLRERVETDDFFVARCFEGARGGVFEALPEPLRGTLMAQQWQPESSPHPDAPAWARFIAG